MAPKTLLLLPLLTPLSLAWGSNQDLYVRDAMPDLDPYAMQAAIRRRALLARARQNDRKVKRSGQRLVFSREINARSANPAPIPIPSPEPSPIASADTNDHLFSQYNAGLFRRDGSVAARDPYANPAPTAEQDPELWFQGGELHAKRERIINAKRALLREKRRRSLFAKRAAALRRREAEAEAEAAANANPEAVAEAQAVVDAEDAAATMAKRSADAASGGGWFGWMKFW